MDRTHQQIVIDRLGRHGLGPEVTDHVRLWTSPDACGEDAERGNITIGYMANGRMRETAMVSMPGIGDAISLLEDRERVATLIALGIGGMPRSVRPPVPRWISDNEGARGVRRDLARAGRLANDASEGRMVDTTTGGKEGDAPF